MNRDLGLFGYRWFWHCVLKSCSGVCQRCPVETFVMLHIWISEGVFFLPSFELLIFLHF